MGPLNGGPSLNHSLTPRSPGFKYLGLQPNNLPPTGSPASTTPADQDSLQVFNLVVGVTVADADGATLQDATATLSLAATDQAGVQELASVTVAATDLATAQDGSSPVSTASLDTSAVQDLASLVLGSTDQASVTEAAAVQVAAADTTTVGDGTTTGTRQDLDAVALLEAVALALADMDATALVELAQVLGIQVASQDASGWWALYHAAQANARQAMAPQYRQAQDQAAILELATVWESPAEVWPDFPATLASLVPTAPPVVPVAPARAPQPVGYRRATSGRQAGRARPVRRRLPVGAPARQPRVSPSPVMLAEDEVVALYLARRLTRQQARALLQVTR